MNKVEKIDMQNPQKILGLSQKKSKPGAIKSLGFDKIYL